MGAGSIARLRLCPCAVNLGTAQSFSPNGDDGDDTMGTHAGPDLPQLTVQHSTARTHLLRYDYLGTAKDRSSLPGRVQIFFISIRKSLVWLLWSLANRCNLSYIARKGGEGGKCPVLCCSSKKKIRSSQPGRLAVGRACLSRDYFISFACFCFPFARPSWPPVIHSRTPTIK